MILISACLLGYDYKYNGGNNKAADLLELLKGKEIRAVCPEVEGGLPVPRPPAEIINGDGFAVLDGKARVITVEDEDVTKEYLAGSSKMLFDLDPGEIEFAVLKAKSPSCGSGKIYSGQFNGTLKQGSGVGAAFLQKNGIKVFSEEEIDSIKRELDR